MTRLHGNGETVILVPAPEKHIQEIRDHLLHPLVGLMSTQW
jgi:hypothetical protein